MKINLAPVNDNPDLGRDLGSGAIINTNSREYLNYMRGLESEQRKNQEISDLQKQVSELKSELGDIKSLLLQIANKQD